MAVFLLGLALSAQTAPERLEEVDDQQWVRIGVLRDEIGGHSKLEGHAVLVARVVVLEKTVDNLESHVDTLRGIAIGVGVLLGLSRVLGVLGYKLRIGRNGSA